MPRRPRAKSARANHRHVISLLIVHFLSIAGAASYPIVCPDEKLLRFAWRLSGFGARTLTAKCVCERLGPVPEMIERIGVGRVGRPSRVGSCSCKTDPRIRYPFY